MLFTDEEAEVRRLQDILTVEPERAGWEAPVHSKCVKGWFSKGGDRGKL